LLLGLAVAVATGAGVADAEGDGTGLGPGLGLAVAVVGVAGIAVGTDAPPHEARTAARTNPALAWTDRHIIGTRDLWHATGVGSRSILVEGGIPLPSRTIRRAPLP
jgi:hypothetical protein